MTPELINRLLNRSVVRQALRFAAVGAVATLTHYLALIALVELAGLKPVTATTIGYCLGIVVSYALNRRYTFGATAPVASSFAKFALLYGVGMALNGFIVATLIGAGAPYLLAQVAATALVLFWNFLGARYFAFR